MLTGRVVYFRQLKKVKGEKMKTQEELFEKYWEKVEEKHSEPVQKALTLVLPNTVYGSAWALFEDNSVSDLFGGEENGVCYGLQEGGLLVELGTDLVFDAIKDLRPVLPIKTLELFNEKRRASILAMDEWLGTNKFPLTVGIYSQSEGNSMVHDNQLIQRFTISLEDVEVLCKKHGLGISVLGGEAVAYPGKISNEKAKRTLLSFSEISAGGEAVVITLVKKEK